MNKFKLAFALYLAGNFLFSGCAAQKEYQTVDQICLTGIGKTAAMTRAQDVLARMNFIIDKADPEEGLITTKPLEAAQFFEFWRKDNAGRFNTAEANLQTIRRTARLNINPISEQICISCDVKTERLNLTEQEISSGAHVYTLFSRSGSSMQKLQLHREQQAQMQWTNLGNDTRLATEILKRIEEKLDTGQKETQP